jgi:hypothetical protein
VERTRKTRYAQRATYNARQKVPGGAAAQSGQFTLKESRMPRTAANPSIDVLVRDAVDGAVAQASLAIARTLARLTAERLEHELGREVARTARRGGGGRTRSGRAVRPPRGELSRWAADRRARRVPKFVIAMTGLETKKKIVAKYGDGALFEKGKPAPKPK